MPASQRKCGYLPGFDGWRAMAILGVLMAHDQLWHFLGHTNARIRGYGGYGVYRFFAISGILICWRILEDEAALGVFHLRSFYIRRLFRIQPAAWAYLMLSPTSMRTSSFSSMATTRTRPPAHCLLSTTCSRTAWTWSPARASPRCARWAHDASHAQELRRWRKGGAPSGDKAADQRF